MEMFPSRFPNEILHDLDVSLLGQVQSVRRIERVEAKRTEWLSPQGATLTPDDWEAIREHDRLVEDYTVKVVEE